MIDYLFVYGTLMRGFDAHSSLEVYERATEAGEARVMGRLYDVDGYPALVTPSDERVSGELYRVDDESLLDAVDRYEGFYPDSPGESIFVRTFREVLDRDLQAWVYVYNGELDGAELVESGDWRQYKAARGR